MPLETILVDQKKIHVFIFKNINHPKNPKNNWSIHKITNYVNNIFYGKIPNLMKDESNRTS
jgi:hypothetical protein